MHRILVEAMTFNVDKLTHFISSHKHIHFILWLSIYEDKWEKRLGNFPNVEIFHQKKLSSGLRTYDVDDYRECHEIITKIQSDPALNLLSYRFGLLPERGFGLYHYLRLVNDYVHNFVKFFKSNKIDFIFFRVTPHAPSEFILAYVAECMKVKVLVCEPSIVPFRSHLCSGFGRERELVPLHGIENDDNSKKLVVKYFDLNSKDYTNAIPNYERKRIGRGIFKFFNPFKELLYYYNKPYSIFHKFLCFQYYKRNSLSTYPKSKSYVIFFLHYQPECSTVPEGYGFEDAYSCLVELRKVLPDYIIILVKEHPSIFTYFCSFTVRNIRFYKDILRLSNVSFVGLDLDNFQLIDNAIFVSTVTGTVNIQSVIRNIPIFNFGRVPFEFDGFAQYRTYDDLVSFTQKVLSNKVNNIRSKALDAIIKSFEYSVGPRILDDDNFDFYDSKNFYDDNHLKLLRIYISHYFN